MIYYNQYDYPHIPYPSPALPKATVASGGCGVCCAAMVVEAISGCRVPPEMMAPYAMEEKARVNGGTDMRRLAESISRDFEMPFSENSRLEALINTLLSGGMVICNVSGDRAGRKGIFSNGGHYIVAAGITGDGHIIVYDPGQYEGKYASTHRKTQVTVMGHRLFVKPETLHADCEGRNPRYYLFEGGGGMTQEKFNSMAQVWEAQSNPTYNTLEEVPEYWREDVRSLIDSGAIRGDGKNPIAMKRETLKAIIVAHRLLKGE